RRGAGARLSRRCRPADLRRRRAGVSHRGGAIFSGLLHSAATRRGGAHARAGAVSDLGPGPAAARRRRCGGCHRRAVSSAVPVSGADGGAAAMGAAVVRSVASARADQPGGGRPGRRRRGAAAARLPSARRLGEDVPQGGRQWVYRGKRRRAGAGWHSGRREVAIATAPDGTERQRGFALLVVLWIITLLALQVSIFNLSVRDAGALAGNEMAMARGEALASAGVELAAALLMEP